MGKRGSDSRRFQVHLAGEERDTVESIMERTGEGESAVIRTLIRKALGLETLGDAIKLAHSQLDPEEQTADEESLAKR